MEGIGVGGLCWGGVSTCIVHSECAVAMAILAMEGGKKQKCHDLTAR